MVNNKQVILNEVNNWMDEIIDKVFSKSQENLINEGKVDTGILLKSGNINRGFLEKEIVYSASWADAVENGRMPGSAPPVSALIPWVKRKLKIRNDKEARRTAFAIANEIKRRGLDGVFFLTNAANSVFMEEGLKVE